MSEPKVPPDRQEKSRSAVEPPDSGGLIEPPPAKKKRTTKPAAEYVEEPVAKKNPAEKKPRFIYKVVSFEFHLGWKARFVDSKEIPEWPETAQVHETLKSLGEDGWELRSVATGECLYGVADFYQMYFIKQK